jgi:hypothetical protein
VSRDEDIDRREFLRRLGATAGGLAGLAAGASALGGCSSQHGSSAPTTHHGSAGTGQAGSTTTTEAVHTGDFGLPIADWLVEENSRPGTTDWLKTSTPHLGVEGYVDQVSAQPEDELTLYATTTAEYLEPKIFRLGWYQGKGARLMADLGKHRGVVQPAPSFSADTRMVECHWQPSLRFEIGSDWPSGYYLMRLGTSKGWAQWVPFVVRDDTSKAAVVVQSAVTTWQAYNLWGGYSLYLGPTAGGGDSVDERSYVVSFDRPYPPSWEDGSADLFGNEYPFVALVERLGVDVTYWTGVDLHARPQLLGNHRLLVSLGHDEYWSSTMRFACQDALSKGVNFAFLGANACYRHIRFEDSPIGKNRRIVCYKTAYTQDPLYGVNNNEVTSDWDAGPVPRPESQLIGIEYQAFQPYGSPFADLVVVDSSHWIMEGTGLSDGATIAGVNGAEFDRYSPGAPSPTNVHIVCHSPITSVSGPSYSDMSYYTASGGGGVFASGTASFVNRLWANPGPLPMPFAPGPIPNVTAPLTRITTNVLAALSAGPGSVHKPSEANWSKWYKAGQTGPPPVDVP